MPIIGRCGGFDLAISYMDNPDVTSFLLLLHFTYSFPLILSMCIADFLVVYIYVPFYNLGQLCGMQISSLIAEAERRGTQRHEHMVRYEIIDVTRRAGQQTPLAIRGGGIIVSAIHDDVDDDNDHELPAQSSPEQ